MLSYKSIYPVLGRARALPLPGFNSPQGHASSIGNRNPFGSGLDACGVTPWAMSFGWPGHEEASSDRRALEERKQSPDHAPEPLSIKRTAIGTGIAALILAVVILNQQIALAAMSALERVGRSAELQGAIAKPLGELVASIFR